MRRNVQRQQTETRSIQHSVQILLTVSGIVFLLAGLVLAASGASVSSAMGSVTDRFDDADQPADDDIESSDGDAADADSGTETDDSGGESGDGGSTDGGDDSDGGGDSNTDGGNSSDTDGGAGDADGDDSDGGDENSSDGDDGLHTLTVTVEDQDGNTVEGADVSHNGSFSNEKTTGVNGEVEWEVGDGNYSVSADADGYQSAEDSVEIDGGDEPLTLTLEETTDGSGDADSSDDNSTVTFAVQDQNGDPLDNATVALDREPLGSLQGKERKTVDQDGEVDFERENGEYSFTVTVDGTESDERTIDVDGDTRQPVTYETTDG